MIDTADKARKALGLPRIYQLGIVVKSIRESMPFYTEFMGIRPWYRGKVGEQELEFGGKTIESDIDMVFGYSGKLMIELIEVRGGEPNLYTEHLDRYGEGLHHLGVEVGDFDACLKRVEAMNIHVLQYGRIVSKGGAVSRMAYLDTAEWCGYPIELMETRLFGIPCGKSEFMMKIGCLLGDAERVKL